MVLTSRSAVVKPYLHVTAHNMNMQSILVNLKTFKLIIAITNEVFTNCFRTPIHIFGTKD
jgi:meiotically up-regulated gene 157 (Mug157) protein